MIAWTAPIALQFALLASPGLSYQDAVKAAERQHKPLLVFVGADWCPGCQTMKRQHLPVLKQHGDFKRVVFSAVDTDQQPELTRRLLRANSIPQLILFVKTAQGWHRAELVGVHAPQEVRSFLAREIAASKHSDRPAAAGSAELGTRVSGR